MLSQFYAWTLQHVDRGQNVAARGEAKVCLNVVKVQEPLFRGREFLAKVENFLLIGKVSDDIPKQKRYRFAKSCAPYFMIDDVLYMKGTYLILKRIPWQEEIMHILEANYEGICGGHFAFKIMMMKILTEGYIWPSLQRDIRHWCRSCLQCQ